VVVIAGTYAPHLVWPGTKLADLLGLIVTIPLGVIVYGFVLWKLKVEGREEFEAIFAKVRGKFA